MAQLLVMDAGQDSIQALVLHDRTLLDLPDLIEDRAGQGFHATDAGVQLPPLQG
jgi:hypothetical protein